MTESGSADDTFTAGLRAGKLLIQRCRCGNAWLPERLACPVCLGRDIALVQASGRASVVSWAVYHRAYADHLKSRVPYNIAIVAFEEGPRMVTNLLGGPPDGNVEIGDMVIAEIDAASEPPLCRFRVSDHPRNK
jgi:uncharacterized OB-fold protein